MGITEIYREIYQPNARKPGTLAYGTILDAVYRMSLINMNEKSGRIPTELCQILKY